MIHPPLYASQNVGCVLQLAQLQLTFKNNLLHFLLWLSPILIGNLLIGFCFCLSLFIIGHSVWFLLLILVIFVIIVFIIIICSSTIVIFFIIIVISCLGFLFCWRLLDMTSRLLFSGMKNPIIGKLTTICLYF